MFRMVCVVRVASVFNSGIYCGTTRVAPNAFRASTTIPQYMTKFVLDLVCYPIGLNVSITV